jgi:S-adenosylmethionine-dependent methyltransferase
MTDDALEKLLVDTYFKNDAAYLQSPAGRSDLRDHLHQRSAKYRDLYGDWLRATIGAGPRRVLEIGIGTGSASLVLVECGFVLDGLEIDRNHADIAVARLAQHQHRYHEVIIGNVVDALPGRDLAAYDAIIFWATLEHMTIAERLAALKLIWPAMKSGARLIVTECPNRLWYFDSHTAGQPFYHWLPDELAQQTGKYAGLDPIAFARTGRGASHHEFLLSGIPVGPQAGIDSLQLFKRRKNLLKKIKWMINRDGRYERLIFQLAHGGVHRAFFHEYLDIAVTKA